MKPVHLASAVIALAVPLTSATLFLVGFFGYASFPTLFYSILCPAYGLPILLANLANILIPHRVKKVRTGPEWLMNRLSVTAVVSGVYTSVHLVFVGIFVNLGLHC